jgi:hypothetical protein
MDLDRVFAPINAKYGYPEMQKIGFFCYRSDGWGDWHKNSHLKNIKVVGNWHGYKIYKNGSPLNDEYVDFESAKSMLRDEANG